MNQDSKSRHGGRRQGAGRKPVAGVSEPSTVLRVPASQAGAIRDFITAYRARLQSAGRDNVVGLAEWMAGRPMALPLFTTKVSAGSPSPVDDHVEQRLNPSDYLVENDSSTFFVRVKGESMIDAGIFDDDVLVVDRSRVASIGDIVLAMLDGEFTVKTLGRSKMGIKLIPANPAYPVIEVQANQSFEVWGVVTGSMRKFK